VWPAPRWWHRARTPTVPSPPPPTTTAAAAAAAAAQNTLVRTLLPPCSFATHPIPFLAGPTSRHVNLVVELAPACSEWASQHGTGWRLVARVIALDSGITLPVGGLPRLDDRHFPPVGTVEYSQPWTPTASAAGGGDGVAPRTPQPPVARVHVVFPRSSVHVPRSWWAVAVVLVREADPAADGGNGGGGGGSGGGGQAGGSNSTSVRGGRREGAAEQPTAPQEEPLMVEVAHTRQVLLRLDDGGGHAVSPQDLLRDEEEEVARGSPLPTLPQGTTSIAVVSDSQSGAPTLRHLLSRITAQLPTAVHLIAHLGDTQQSPDRWVAERWVGCGRGVV
jgi:hypothetical protein